MFEELLEMDLSEFKTVTFMKNILVIEFHNGMVIKASSKNEKIIAEYKEKIQKMLKPCQIIENKE